jgi:nitroimidazol reductase NimA-like FMN-containing flavoprotein (pyridoxamine 5'-phosphate oxidase superfamily)
MCRALLKSDHGCLPHLELAGEFIYGLAEDNTLYCFSTKEGKLEHIMQVREAVSQQVVESR